MHSVLYIQSPPETREDSLSQTTLTAHLADAFRWSTEAPVDWAAVLSAGIGMAGPIAVAAAVGDLPSGYAAALGSLIVGRMLPARAGAQAPVRSPSTRT
jgi:hypothetical protein